MKSKNLAYPIHELLAARWSPRAFSDRLIERHKIMQLFEAARWSPSSSNGQPWRFIFSTRDQEEIFGRLLSCLDEGNKRWAQDAPLLLLVCSRLRFERNDRLNRHYMYDAGLAAAFMTFQAQSMDIYIHQMAGFNRESAIEILKIPADYEPVTMVAAGYLGSPEQLPEDLAKREEKLQERKPLEAVVYEGSWGQGVAD